MNSKMTKFTNMIRLPDIKKQPNFKISSSLSTKSSNKKSSDAEINIQPKDNHNQKIIYQSQQRLSKTPKIRKLNRLLTPMVLDPYKNKEKNYISHQKNIRISCLTDRKRSKNFDSAIKTNESIQRQNSSQANRPVTQVKNIKKFKQLLKGYLPNKPLKILQNYGNCPTKQIIKFNRNELQRFNKPDSKRQIIDKIMMKGKYRWRLNQGISEDKVYKNQQQLKSNYWNNVLESQISFKESNEFNQESLIQSILKIN